MQAQLNPETDGDMGLPQKIHHYHTLYPLEVRGDPGHGKGMGQRGNKRQKVQVLGQRISGGNRWEGLFTWQKFKVT